MIYRLKTSKEASDILKELHSKTNLTPNVLSRLAISLSLLNPSPIDNFESDTNGIEFNRNTLTGDFDQVFHALISQHCNRHLTDEEFFPVYIKKHLDRGVKILEAEYKYTGNFEKFILHLTTMNREVII